MHLVHEALTLLLITTGAYAAENIPQAGRHCLASVDVVCELPGGDPCSDLYDISDDGCGPTALKYTYKWSNLNQDTSIDLFPDSTIPTIQNEVVAGFDKSRMLPGESREKAVTKIVDTCKKGKANASLKLEGYVTGYIQEDGTVIDGYDCFAWKRLKVLIRHGEESVQDTVEKPVQDTVEKPVQDKVKGPPELALEIQCRVESHLPELSGIPCSELENRFMTDRVYFDITQIPVKYTYIVTNADSYERSVRIQGLVSKCEFLPIDDFIQLDFKDKYVFEASEIIDLSQGPPDSMIIKEAMVVGASIPNLTPGTASAKHSFSLPVIPPSIEWTGPSVQCTYQGVSCQDYIDTNGCFSGEVDLQYNIKNSGPICNSIERVNVLFGSVPSHPLALDDAFICSDRRICPGEIWSLKEKRVISACSIREIKIILEMTTVTTTTTISTISTEISTLYKNWSLIPAQCTSRPTKVWFKFTGSNCPSTRRRLDHNSGNKNNKSKHKCSQLGEMNGNYSMIIRGQNSDVVYFDSNVSVEEVIEISDSYKLPANSDVEVYSAQTLVQTMTIHTSCSGGFELGQKFGAVEAYGFENKEQGVMKMHQ